MKLAFSQKPFVQHSAHVGKLCVSLHDVAPATLDHCAATLELLEKCGATPVALLVVPDYQGLGRADRDARFADFIASRILRGDEVVMQGLRDSHAVGRTTESWSRLLRGELRRERPEFAALEAPQARAKLLRGLSVLRSAGLEPRGFVASDWKISEGTREALVGLPLNYFSTRDSIVSLFNDTRIDTPSLVIDSRSRWHHPVSPVWHWLTLARHRRMPIIRASLYPWFHACEATQRLWQALLANAGHRRFVTEGELIKPRTARRALADPIVFADHN